MRLAAALAALLACACQPQAPATEAPVPTRAIVVPEPRTLPPGSTLVYLRMNWDRTMQEHVLVHVVSPTELHVAKMVSPCTDAAYVTAVFDPATREATRLVGGRLQKDGTQLPQAFLDLDAATRKLSLRLGDPSSAPAETHDAPSAPWRMYDFDFAEFALFGPREPKDFSFGLALAWPDGPPPLVRVLGPVRARHFNSTIGADGKLDSNIYMLESPELPGGDENAIHTDASYGYVELAYIRRPNHPGYAQFQLQLQEAAIETGDQVWRDALAAHWKDC